MKFISAIMLLSLCACASKMRPPPPPPPLLLATDTQLAPWQDNFGTPRDAAIAIEVREFIIERQGCDHFRGEPAYDENRRAFLEEKVEQLCIGTDQKLSDLRVKYVDDAINNTALAEFDDCIEISSPCNSEEE